MPESLVAENIIIRTPRGQETIDNPLYAYRFHPLPVGTDIPGDYPVCLMELHGLLVLETNSLQLVSYQETVRSPDPNTGRSRMENVQLLLRDNAAWYKFPSGTAAQHSDK